ncbi:MAG: response regulator [Desulfobacterales bacterium]|nr:response regulator [Desulfobacterales bacterium]
MDKKVKKVLLVDDHELNRDKIKYILEEIDLFDIKVITSDNGTDAIKISKSMKFDIIFLDLNLGDMTGEKVLKSIRSFDKQTKVILLTATNEEDLTEYLKAASSGHIHKSIKRKQFQESIIKFLNT